MSNQWDYAWEVTREDVDTVLEAHGEGLISQHIWDNWTQEWTDRVMKTVMYYTDFEEQCDECLSQIEDILIEEGTLKGPKKFTV